MSRKIRKNVGVIGLGIIGSRVAAGLRASGYQVYVWNRSARPAPNFLGSPAEVAESAEIIQIFVSDAQALYDVIEAMGETLTPKHLVLCNSTVGPEGVLEAAQLVQARGAQFLDAPFTGSRMAAEKRQLVYYVGGSDIAFNRARPVLEVTSKAIVRMGDIGNASTIKVVTNMISAVTVQVLSEALSIVQKAGIEPELLAAAIEQNACRSGVIDLKLPKMMNGDYEPHFSLKHMFKDVQLGIHMANALDIEVPATTVTAGVMYGALNQGWGDLDFSVLFKNYTPTETYDDLPELERMVDQPEAAGEEPMVAAPLPLNAPPVTATASPEPAAPTAGFKALDAPVAPMISPPVIPPPEFIPPVTTVVSSVLPSAPVPPIPLAPPPSEPVPAPGAHAGSTVPASTIPADLPAPEIAPPPPKPPVAAAPEQPSSLEPAAFKPAPAPAEPARELLPTEEASKIIESVLAHVSSQRAEMGVTGRHADGRTTDASGGNGVHGSPNGETMIAPEAKPVGQASEQTAVSGGSEMGEANSAAKPMNFVRRWFVGRS